MSEYTSPSAVVRAISDVAKSQAKEVGGNTAAIVEMEYRNRLLTRVFVASDPSWVLKGGTSTLVRLPDARATKDIDLLRESGTLEAAIEELKKLAALDLGDFFRFTLLTSGPILEGEGQGAREGAVLVFDVYCGQKKLNRVSVDLVVSRTPLTSAVEVGESPLAKKLPMLPHRLYRLYPLSARSPKRPAQWSKPTSLISLRHDRKIWSTSSRMPRPNSSKVLPFGKQLLPKPDFEDYRASTLPVECLHGTGYGSIRRQPIESLTVTGIRPSLMQ
ncbi:hypothetical protein BKA07_001656 [Brevibacterium marinum]|uniref:Nucleotidyl transferase AbiEii toxin, Type IV TA system n=1 Tax=Brevibacterium marinum TaxID=418643 RepID=A0A846S3A3_9MICO|nr:nucleotidyl transferase AbiEii/AbiGii toxin family protein [Brevibacterium marinum]NJC56621.1 hypothetical protein [Brevibacterium marinum]